MVQADQNYAGGSKEVLHVHGFDPPAFSGAQCPPSLPSGQITNLHPLLLLHWEAQTPILLMKLVSTEHIFTIVNHFSVIGSYYKAEYALTFLS